ncbi:MAG: DUF1571 domain-containing protein [Planctomycetota bacterium]|nr:MAG: DUF1571 domain-containing protein [Planctomycetota bacterium]
MRRGIPFQIIGKPMHASVNQSLRMPWFAKGTVGALLLIVTWIACASERSFQKSSEDVRYRAPRAAAPDVTDSDSAIGFTDDSATAPTLEDLIAEAEEILESMRRELRDYRGTLLRRERIAGVLGEEVRMKFKIRNAYQRDDGTRVPFSVYLLFEAPPSVAGREVIWVDGANDGKLIAHEGGLKRYLGRMELDPNGPVAMFGNKYPITEIGLVRMVETLLQRARELPYLQRAQIRQLDNVPVGDRPCRLYEIKIAQKAPDRLFHLAQIYIDTQRRIPLKYAAYGWPDNPGDAPPLDEAYTYLDVETNVGLSDADFDPDNPEYNFP